MALGSARPAAAASANHRENWLTQSGARSPSDTSPEAEYSRRIAAGSGGPPGVSEVTRLSSPIQDGPNPAGSGGVAEATRWLLPNPPSHPIRILQHGAGRKWGCPTGKIALAAQRNPWP